MGQLRRTETLVTSPVLCQTLNVDCMAANHVRLPQKKGVRPIVNQIKYVKVFCV